MTKGHVCSIRFYGAERLLDTFYECYENERNGVSLGSSVKCVYAFRSALT